MDSLRLISRLSRAALLVLAGGILALPAQAVGPRIFVNGKMVIPVDSPRYKDTTEARIQKLLALERAEAAAVARLELAAKRRAEAPHPAVTGAVRHLLAWVCEPAPNILASTVDRFDPKIRGALDMTSLSGVMVAYEKIRRMHLWIKEIDPGLHAAMAMPTWTELFTPEPAMALTPAPAPDFTAALPTAPKPRPVPRLKPAERTARIAITSLLPLDFENNVLFADLPAEAPLEAPAEESSEPELIAAADEPEPVVLAAAEQLATPIMDAEILQAEEVVAYEPDPESGAAPASLLQEVTAPALAVAEPPAPAVNPMADIAAPSNAIRDVAAQDITLASVTRQRGFLDEAWVSYDEDAQVWEAKWPKPPMFHYGSVLLPVLASRMETGQSVNFEMEGRPARITKREDGKLVVARGGDPRLVSANDIRSILESKIESEGMILFLDRQGNLVLQATGNQAVAMANEIQKGSM